MKLYGYWRSTSSYRVRIALALKGLDVDQAFVHLVRNGGEQNRETYRAINPQGRVPTLVLDDGTPLTQSSAIIEYIEETHPAPRLLPDDSLQRARARAVAATIGGDIQPFHNVGTLSYLRHTFSRSDEEVAGWLSHWIADGLQAVEALVEETGPYCFGSQPGLADIFLIPQLYAARRFELALESFPRLRRVEEFASRHPAFVKAHPASQRDSE